MSRNDERPSRVTDDLIEHEPIEVGQHSAVVIYDRHVDRLGAAETLGVAYVECGCGWGSIGGRFATVEDALAAVDLHLADARRLAELEEWLSTCPTRPDVTGL